MRNLRLSTLGGICALLAVAGFATGIALMATNGVQVLIPETGRTAPNGSRTSTTPETGS